jgi:hypothetical protein
MKTSPVKLGFITKIFHMISFEIKIFPHDVKAHI